jgi:cytochrome c-type biogenesis protein CcmH/NrfF
MSRRFALAIAVFFLTVPMAAFAQIPPGEGVEGAYEPHPEATEAIGKLKSPYCPGLMLEVCPSPQAASLRDSIEMLAQEGWASDSLVTWMLANHGEEWRAIPKSEGKGILAWLMPPAALLLGLGLVGLVLRKIAPPKEKVFVGEVELSAEEELRMKDALRELEEEDEPVI